MEGGKNNELSSSVFISYLFSFLVAISDNWLVRFCPCDNPTLTQAVTYNNVHILRLGWAKSPSNMKNVYTFLNITKKKIETLFLTADLYLGSFMCVTG